MPNIAAVLREEIQRLARKEKRAANSQLHKDCARLKRDVAALKRQVTSLTRDNSRLTAQVAQLRKQARDPEAKEVQAARFGPKLIAALRRKLKLTREDFATLVGVSANSVYLWENGQATPRAQSRAALVELRGIGVREARRRVEEAG